VLPMVCRMLSAFMEGSDGERWIIAP